MEVGGLVLVVVVVVVVIVVAVVVVVRETYYYDQLITSVHLIFTSNLNIFMVFVNVVVLFLKNTCKNKSVPDSCTLLGRENFCPPRTQATHTHTHSVDGKTLGITGACRNLTPGENLATCELIRRVSVPSLAAAALGGPMCVAFQTHHYFTPPHRHPSNPLPFLSFTPRENREANNTLAQYGI